MNIEEITVDHLLYEKALDLRYELFFKGFNLPKSVTADELESDSMHVVLSNGTQLLSYGRLSPLGSGTYRISQIVVPEKYRRNGYATIVVKQLVDLAKQAAPGMGKLKFRYRSLTVLGRLGARAIEQGGSPLLGRRRDALLVTRIGLLGL